MKHHEEVTKRLCKIVGLVYRSIGNYGEPSDGFCRECLPNEMREIHFQHAGLTIDYVENAVRKQLVADGYELVEVGDVLAERSQ